ncbi:MAG: hypothetical protein SPL50_04750 [Alloprevotella sp.]|nr:hypothetical protein [Alloprevotella sp.]
MENLTMWFGDLPPALRIYWGIAIFASVIFIIQIVLTFIGIGDTDLDTGGADGADGDTMDTGGVLQLFTVRNFVNFLLGVGWGGVCLWGAIPNTPLLILASIIVGTLFVGVFVFMFRNLRRLEHTARYDLHDAVGQIADVYLRIPAERNGEGKIQTAFGGSVQELPAVTDGDDIPSGSKVHILAVIGDHTFLVEKAE